MEARRHPSPPTELRCLRSSSPAATRISISRSSTADGTWSYRNVGRTSTTPPAKPTTRSPSSSASAIPAARGSTRSPRTEIPRAVPFTFAQIKQKPADARRQSSHRTRKPHRTRTAGASTSPSAASRPPCSATSRLTTCARASRARRAALRRRRLHRQAERRKCTREALRRLRSSRRSTSSPPSRRASSATCSNQTFAAAEHFGARSIVVSGGVAANSELRRRLQPKPPRGLPAGRLSLARPLHRQRRHDRRRRVAQASRPATSPRTTLSATPQLAPRLE